jgi:L,D-transpeptidase ErfK/SrfK
MKKNRMIRSALFALLAFAGLAGAAQAAVYPLPPPGENIVGEVRSELVYQGETLLDIGRRHGLGFEEIRRANPDVDLWLPEPGTEIVLPTRHILPAGPRKGIVLNVAELRLYYYPPPKPGEQAVVETYAVSIGRMDWSTPLGSSVVTQKLRDPAWYPPASVRQAAAADGVTLPRVVPPGPDNPIGPHALRLDIPGYFIHSTNEPWGVGTRVTHGCVRMYPENIADLFDRIPVGTPVRIVNQPYKTAWQGGKLFLQAYPPLEEDKQALKAQEYHAFAPALEVVADALLGTDHKVDYFRVREVLEQKRGIPVPISRGLEVMNARHSVAAEQRTATR